MMDFDDTAYASILESLFYTLDKLPYTWTSLADASDGIHKCLLNSYSEFINVTQQDDAFKQYLFTSLENLIMAAMHKKLFHFICSQTRDEDEFFYTKFRELSELKVTPDQLGALEDYSIPLPAAIVELASLDYHETPMDKRICLSTAFDLTMAELKGAIVDVIALTSDNTIPTLNITDITPILATIIIRAKPIHLISNLIYIEQFCWSKMSNTESECMLAFKTAIDKLRVITVDMLLPRSARIYCDLGLEDMIKITKDCDDKYDRSGERICTQNNPLERHIEQFTNMITASTLNHVQT